MTLWRVLYHGRCFDGAVSAALLLRLLRALGEPEGGLELVRMGHGPGSPYTPESFTAELNAVVDFRYSPDPRLTWWFDHHQSTFLAPEDEAHLATRDGRRHFYDPRAPSCAGLIARVAERTHGVSLVTRDPELLAWADEIDSAAFPDPATAVRLESPALRLMTWLEAAATAAEEATLVRELAAGARLAELPSRAYVAPGLATALERHFEVVDVVRARMVVEQRVAFIDLGDLGLAGVNKFIPYDLDPTLDYTITVLCPPGKAKVSVGSNPWAQDRRRHDIASLCERYGGGGHPAVGAVTLRAGELDRARAIGRELAALLRAELPGIDHTMS
jgi:hypothetical protein